MLRVLPCGSEALKPPGAKPNADQHFVVQYGTVQTKQGTGDARVQRNRGHPPYRRQQYSISTIDFRDP